MSVKGAGSIPKIHFPAAPKAPKMKDPVVAGPPAAKFKAPPALKIPSLESPSMRSRRGQTPKIVLAKAAAGASSTRSKRNPDYPTP